MSEPGAERRFVSRAGRKMEHALDEFEFDVSGLTCADFGCNVGGFTDCLLQRSAKKVYAIDTGYGTLAYALRTDNRVVVMERTNALHAEPPERVDLVVVDLAWTPQRHAIPAAVRWLTAPLHARGRGTGGEGQKDAARIITLVKPHYELTEDEKRELLTDGRLDPGEAERVLHRVLEAMPDWGVQPIRWTRSPITGGKSGRKAKCAEPGQIGPGNVEFLVLARPINPSNIQG